MHQQSSGHSELDSIAALLPAFEFQGLIARGASGPVYKASQRSLDREVAIRVAPRELAADPAFRESFRAMAKAMAGLAHPGLIRVYDSGEVDGQLYMVMEYVPGKSLQHSARGKAVDPRQAAQIVLATCQGLAHAHGAGKVHGAIHPAQILLTTKFEPKIGNFGFARTSRAADPYSAPELAAAGTAATSQSDVFAVGMMLRELLTGIPAGTPGEAQAAIADAKLAAICRQATHSDPARRFRDADALAEALGQWLSSRNPLRTPLPQASAARRPVPATTATRVPVVSYPGAKQGRVLLAQVAIIAALLFAIHGVWGAYQAKQESLARLRSMEESKPRVIIVTAPAGKPAAQGIDPSLVQLKP